MKLGSSLSGTTVLEISISGRLRRTPDEQAVLHHADERVEHQCARRQHRDAGKDRVDVEDPFGLEDEVADPSGRTEVFADYGPYERHTDGGMQAGEDPAGG